MKTEIEENEKNISEQKQIIENAKELFKKICGKIKKMLEIIESLNSIVKRTGIPRLRVPISRKEN